MCSKIENAKEKHIIAKGFVKLHLQNVNITEL